MVRPLRDQFEFCDLFYDRIRGGMPMYETAIKHLHRNSQQHAVQDADVTSSWADTEMRDAQSWHLKVMKGWKLGLTKRIRAPQYYYQQLFKNVRDGQTCKQ